MKILQKESNRVLLSAQHEQVYLALKDTMRRLL